MAQPQLPDLATYTAGQNKKYITFFCSQANMAPVATTESTLLACLTALNHSHASISV